MNININEISKKISDQLDLLEEIVKKENNSLFDIICEFQLGTIESKMEIYNKLENIKKNDTGIYLFEIKKDINQKYEEWIEIFTNRFRGPLILGKHKFLHQFTPNVINKRKNNHKAKEGKQELEWIPLYLGKSMDMKERIVIHIFSELGKPPFALKLNNRLDENKNKIFSSDIFRLKVVRLENLQNKDMTYNSVVSHLEKILRKEFSPIVGKQ